MLKLEHTIVVFSVIGLLKILMVFLGVAPLASAFNLSIFAMLGVASGYLYFNRELALWIKIVLAASSLSLFILSFYLAGFFMASTTFWQAAGVSMMLINGLLSLFVLVDLVPFGIKKEER